MLLVRVTQEMLTLAAVALAAVVLEQAVALATQVPTLDLEATTLRHGILLEAVAMEPIVADHLPVQVATDHRRVVPLLAQAAVAWGEEQADSSVNNQPLM